jgi:hypothetical protein
MTLIIQKPTGAKLVMGQTSYPDIRNGIVTSGLVMNLDAGQTASYPGTGTTWTDLSGSGNNGTLVNGPTYSSADGGSIAFSGSPQHATATLSASLGSQYSIFAFFKKNDNLEKNIINVGSVELIIDESSGNSKVYDGADKSFRFRTITGAWYGVAVVKNSTNGFVYINSSLVLSFTGSSTNASTAVVIGKHPTASVNYINGNIAQASIYNRALAATEVEQNFNCLRMRYGI